MYMFQLDDENIKDMIDLARYVYNEEGKSFEEGIGELRSIVDQYMILNVTVLSPYADFTELLVYRGHYKRLFYVCNPENVVILLRYSIFQDLSRLLPTHGHRTDNWTLLFLPYPNSMT